MTRSLADVTDASTLPRSGDRSESRLWWDVAVAVVLVVSATWAVLDAVPPAALGAGWALSALAAYAVAYVGLARPALRLPDGSRRGTAFLVVAALVLGLGVASAPMLATVQAVTYPLAWRLADGVRHAIGASVGIALAVGLGTVVAHGGIAAGWFSGGVTAALSLAFAIGMGLWITRIWEYGDERARLVTELTAAQEQIAALNRDRGAAAERERVARDIHDTLAQTLTGLVLLAERAGRQARTGQSEAATRSVEAVETVARDALAEARALVARTAAVPAEPAFAEAVERLVAHFRADAGLAIDLDVGCDADPHDREAQIVLLRCLQEALSNVRKHAGASRVAVTVRADATGATGTEATGATGTDAAGTPGTPGTAGTVLEVRDDGAGFDPAAPRTGFGLDGMTERAALAGGAVRVASAPGWGTTVTVTLPSRGLGAWSSSSPAATEEVGP